MIRTASIDRPSVAPALPAGFAALRAIAEAGGDVAFVVDAAGHCLRYLSPGAGQLLGYGAGDLQACLADPALAGPPAALADTLRTLLARGSAAGEARELELPCADGSTVPVQLVWTIVADEAGVPVALAGIIRDQSAVRALHAGQKRFASMLNHEFRTPLAVIDGAVQRLEATAAGADEATRQRYRKIGAAVDRLIGMLDQYLSPDRMAALGKSAAPAAIDPAVLLGEAAEQARAAGRPLALSADALPAALRGDRQGLRLALKVLIDNALAFTPPGSAIALSGYRVANGLELRVRDHGPGVPAADVARIFDKAYRGSNAAGLPGSGLGLYIARSLIEVHGGTLELEANGPDGAVFQIWLPTNINRGKVVASAEPSSDNRSTQAGGRP
jgi:signal transduction histidine kinase